MEGSLINGSKMIKVDFISTLIISDMRLSNLFNDLMLIHRGLPRIQGLSN